MEMNKHRSPVEKVLVAILAILTALNFMLPNLPAFASDQPAAESAVEQSADVSDSGAAEADQSGEVSGGNEAAADTGTDQTSGSSDTQTDSVTTRITMPAQTFSESTMNGVRVTVKAPAGAFPSGTKMTVTPVSKSAALSIARQGSDSPKDVVDAVGVDITFHDSQGNEIEPANSKKISVKMVLTNDLKGEKFHVVHNDADKGPVEISKASGSSASFRTGDFSIYVIDGENPPRATYVFHDADGNVLPYTKDNVTFDKQIIKNNETLYSPDNPEKDGYIFKGWTSTEGSSTVEQEPFDSVNPSVTETTTINYYPVFEEAHYVFFMDSNDTSSARVYETKKGVSGDTISTDDVIIPTDANHKLMGWYTDPGLTNKVDTITLGDENVYLYPDVEEGHWIEFDTGEDASYIAPVFVPSDENTTAPTDPTRQGYTFAGWSTTEGSDTPDYTFGQTLTDDITLYAVWEPAETTYTVQYWRQSVTDDKNAADEDKKYEYDSSETRTAVTGEEVSPSSLDMSSQKAGTGFYFDETNSQPVTVKGDGSTILNVYYDRMLVTFKFDDSWNGNEISDFTMSGLYESTLAFNGYTWPATYQGNGVNWNDYLYSNPMYAQYYFQWTLFKPTPTPGRITYSDDGKSVEQRFCAAYKSGTTFRYYMQNTNGDDFQESDTPVSTVHTSRGGVYAFENNFSGFTVNKYRTGNSTANMGGWQALNPDGTSTVPINKSYVDVFYTRNQYHIDYFSGGSKVNTSDDIYFEASLEEYGEDGSKYYVPERPENVPEGSTFEGWYKYPQCTQKYNFANSTMPAGNIVVYAKWAPPEYKVTVYSRTNSTELGYMKMMFGSDDHLTVPYHGQINENDMPQVMSYDGTKLFTHTSGPELRLPQGMSFIGWATKDENGELHMFNFDTKLESDITLYPVYRDLGPYTVTYDANGGTGTVTDSKKYAAADETYADIQSAQPITPPTGEVFLYWCTTSDGTGDRYYPGEKLKMTGNVTLYAIYGVLPSVTHLTYDSNYPADAAGVTHTTKNQTVNGEEVLLNNQDLTVYTKDEAGFETPSGYKFIGWNTKADGSGDSFKAGDTVGVDVNDDASNILYAQWAKEPDKHVYTGTSETNIDGQPVEAGQILTYKIHYKNTTGKTAEIKITDTIPEHTAFQSADNGGTESGGVVTWNATLENNEEITVSFTVKVDDDVNGATLSNTGNVEDTTNDFNIDTNPVENPPTPTDPTKDVFKEGDLTQSIDGQTVQAGDKLVYQITYTNTTGEDVTATIKDTIPSNSEFVSADNGGTESGGVVTWTKQVANGDSVTVSFTVKVKENNGTALKNKADVNDGSNDYTTNEVTNPTPTEPEKDVFKEGELTQSIDGQEVQAGDKLVYQITYTNTTGEEVTATIRDTIPANSEFVSADNGGTESGGVVTWTKTVADGDSVTVSFTVKVKENNGTALSNKADVNDGHNDYTTNEVENPTPTEPEKDVFKEGNLTQSIDGKEVQAGDKLVYKITYTNTTGEDVTATIRDTIPANSEFVSADNGGTESGGVVTWTKQVTNGDSVTVSFTVKVKENNGTALNNKADVNDGHNDYTTNEVTNPTPTEPEKTVFTGGSTTNIDGELVQPEQELTYKIKYTNTTGEDVTVTITDSIPEYTTYVTDSVSEGGEYDPTSKTVKWIKSVDKGKSVEVSFKVKVDKNVNGSVVSNESTVNDGNNSYTTNEVKNPTPTEPVKDVFKSSDTTTSIDGKLVRKDEVLLYKITYTNTTGEDVTATITDEIPDNCTYVYDSAGDGHYSASDRTITWTKQVANGDSVTVSFMVQVDADNGVTLKNDATVNDGSNNYTTNEVTNPTGNPTEPEKDVFKEGDLTQSIDGQTVQAGDKLVYKITYTNTTGEDVTATIKDTIPANSEFVSADNGGTESGGVVTWTKSVAKDASVTVSFTVKVKANDGTALKNKADVNDGHNDYTTNEVTNPTPTEPEKDVFKEGELTQSIDGKEVQAGDRLVYKITYTNTTGKDVTATIKDTIPANSEFVSADNGGTANNGVVTWTKSVAKGDSITVSFTVKVKENSGTALKNKADVNDGHNDYTTNEVENPTPTEPEKTVYTGGSTTNIDGETVQPEQELTYKIKYTNTTGEDVTVTITDSIPEHTTYVTDSVSEGGEYDPTSKTVKWIKSVDKGKSVEVSFKVKVDKNVNGAVVSNDSTVNDGHNDYTTNEVKNPTPTEPEKDVFKEGALTQSIDGKEVQAGDKLVYMITYKNTTGKDVTATIRDTIPANSEFVSADNDGTESNGVVTWTKSVAKGDSVTVSFTVKVKENNGTALKNKADVNDGHNDYTTNEVENPTPTEPEKDVFKEGELTQSIDGQEVQAGDKLVYQITYTNTTGKDVTATIKDTIPSNSEFVSADNGGSESNGVVTWTKQVASGDSVTVSFTVKVKSNDGTALKNKADVNDGHNDYTTNEVENPTPTEPEKDVFKEGELMQSIDGQEVRAGDKLVYQITYTNTTGKDVTATIKDTIPSNSEFVSADNDGTESGGVVTWTKSVAKDASVTVSFTVKVKENNGTALKNKADVNDGHNDYTTNEVENPTPTEPEKDVFKEGGLTQSIDGKEVQAGDKLVYKITYKNTTGKDVTATIKDTIPANSEFVSADNGGTESGGVVSWTKSVAKGESVTVSFTVKVKENNGTALKNKADVNDGHNDYTTNEVENPTPTEPEKTVYTGGSTTNIDGETVQPEQELTYKIKYTNTTGEDVTVTITDSIPEHTTYVTDSVSEGGEYDPTSRTVKWIKSVDKGKSVEVSFKVKVDKNVNGAVVSNDSTVNDGNNSYTTNEVKNPTPTEPVKDVFKSSDPETSIDGKLVRKDEVLLYKITYKNTTGEDVTATITDKIPDNSTYVYDSAGDGHYSDSDRTIKWTKHVANGDSVTVSFKVQVKADDGTTLENDANVNDGHNDYTTNEVTNPTGDPTEPTKDVYKEGELTQSIDGQEVQAGDKLVYKITYTNTTGEDVTATIKDTIPANSEFVSADNDGTENNGVVTWTKSVAKDKSVTVSFTVKVKDNDGTVLKNKADVNDGHNDYTTNEVTNPTPTEPEKDVFKEGALTQSIDGQEVQAGDKLVYKITYTNTTGKNVTATIRDTIPANSEFVSADNGGTENGGVVTWTKSVAKGESVTVSFTVKVKANDGTALKNKADVNDGHNDYTTNEVENPTPTEPEKDVFKEGDVTQSIDGKEVQAGDRLVYKITYTNTTGEDVTATIKDTIPANSEFVSADNGGTESSGVITWTKSVAKGESVTVSFTVKVKENNGTALKNKADVNDGHNDYTTNEVTNPTPTEPVKDVFKSSDTSTSIDGKLVRKDEVLLYKITYTNTTGEDVTATITDEIPENSTYVYGSAGDGHYIDSDRTIKWTKHVANGDSVTVSFMVQVNADNGVTLKNDANVNDGHNDYTTNEVENPTPTKPEKDVFREGELTQSIDGKEVNAGDKLVYKITYTNTTGKDVTATIKDTIPANSEFVSADNGGTESGGVVTWTKAVSSGDSVTVSFTVKVKANDGTAVQNKADVNDGHNDYTTNEVENPTPTEPEKDVFKEGNLTQSIDGKEVNAGDRLVYKITYENTTGKDVIATIKDTIPANSEFVSADNGGTESGGVVTWTKSVANGDSITVSFTVKVKENNGTAIKNKADVNDGHNDYTTNEVENPTPTEPVKDVFKYDGTSSTQNSIDGKLVQSGEELLYKITYKNTTGEDVTATITDSIPANSEYVDGSASSGGEFDGEKVTWSNVAVAAGGSVDVTFRVRVKANDGTELTNAAAVNDGHNDYTTNEVTNTTPTDPTKDVFGSVEETSSIDGQTVEIGQELVYRVTYRNTTGVREDVLIRDAIPVFTEYIDGSADHDGIYDADAKELSWRMYLDPGESVTVSFRVTVTSDVDGSDIENIANVRDAENGIDIDTNKVVNPTEVPVVPPDETPQDENPPETPTSNPQDSTPAVVQNSAPYVRTGDIGISGIWAVLAAAALAAGIAAVARRKRRA
jgi:uncharacterized repeat protein (TIGR02543 family)/uncharacterized repeat protein (TIGR01451 family)